MSEHEQGVFNVVALEKASVDIYTHVYDQLLSLPYYDDTCT